MAQTSKINVQSSKLNVRFLPKLFSEETNLDNVTAIVVDVLRASTTICSALANGADCVIARQEIEEAEKLKSIGAADLTGGERSGIKVEGFDLGNSPLEYSHKVVGGKIDRVYNHERHARVKGH